MDEGSKMNTIQTGQLTCSKTGQLYLLLTVIGKFKRELKAIRVEYELLCGF